MICGYEEEPLDDSDSSDNEPPGRYKEICVAHFDAFPFSNLQSSPKAHAICNLLLPKLKGTTDVCVCNDCDDVLFQPNFGGA